jgi:hypothetical protein
MAVIELLVTNGAYVNALGRNGFSPLLAALDFDKHGTAILLIRHSGNLNPTDL